MRGSCPKPSQMGYNVYVISIQFLPNGGFCEFTFVVAGHIYFKERGLEDLEGPDSCFKVRILVFNVQTLSAISLRSPS